MVLPQFFLPIPAARVGARSVSACKENQMMGENFFWQLWQCHCRKWEEKKISLRQWHYRNRGYKFLAIVAMALSK